MVPSTTIPALAISRTRNESQHKQLHVHFKHPIEEDDPMISRGKKEYMRKSNSLVDPLVQLHAKEIIAAKLIEGYYLKGNGEKCSECLMPLMVKDSAWDGVFCGQGWYRSQKAGVCVVCNPEPNDDDSNATDDLLDTPREHYNHCIPSFPEDDQSDDGSVDQFRKKFAITTEVHAKKSEMKEEEDELAVAELNVHVKPGDSKYCPSCGMEMLYFEEDLECPFCAVELVKQELGIAGFQADEMEQEINNKTKKEHEVVEGLYLSGLETRSSSSCSTLSESVRFAEVRHDRSQKSERDAGVISTHVKASNSTNQEDSITNHAYKKVPTAQAQSEACSTELAVNAILKRLIAGFWKENNDKSSQGSCTVYPPDRRPSSDNRNVNAESVSANASASEEAKVEEADISNALNEDTVCAIPEIPEKEVEEDVSSMPSKPVDELVCSESHGPHCDEEIVNQTRIAEASSPECQNSEHREEIACVTSNLGDMDLRPNKSDDFFNEESSLFHDDNSTNNTINEIVMVTSSILAQRHQQPINTSPNVSPWVEEENIRSRIDPPSESSRDPPHLVTNTDEIVEEDLLLLRNKHSSPDSRDPPTIFSDKYQPRLEFMFPETSPYSCAGRDAMDPSEHGGSLDLDSFSHKDGTEAAPSYHPEMINDVQSAHEPEAPPRDLVSLKSNVATSCRDPPDLASTSSLVVTAKKTDGVIANIAHQKMHYQQPDILKKTNHGVRLTESMKPDPISFHAVKASRPRAEDLYQQPDILKSMVHNHESSRDKIVQQRLLQLESRYQKLTSPLSKAGSQSTAVERHQDSNAKSIFRNSRSNFDSVELHKSFSVSEVSSWNVRENGPGLSSSAIARHEHYKKELYAREKNSINSQNKTDGGPFLSPTAVQRRRHYKEVLRVKMAQQGTGLATQE